MNGEKSNLYPISTDLIDWIHQSIIELECNPTKNEIQKIFEKSISNVDKNFDQTTTEKLFILIYSCFPVIYEQSTEFFDDICINARKSANRLILCSIILTLSDRKSLSTTVKTFVREVMSEIFSQIQNQDEKFKIFNIEINDRFKANFISDIILTPNLTEKNVLKFYPYIFSQKNLSKMRIDKLIQKVIQKNFVSSLPEFILVDKYIFKYFSQEDLSILIRKTTKTIFKTVLNLIEETFSNYEKLNQFFVYSILKKLIEFDINFDLLNGLSVPILNSLTKSMLKPEIWEYFIKNNINLPKTINLNIENFPCPIVALKMIDDINIIPIDILAQTLLEVNDKKLLERLINYDFTDKKSEIFADSKFWIHILQVISTSNSKCSKKLINQFSKIFEQSVHKKKLYKVFEAMIFHKFPTNYIENNFLFNLYINFSFNYVENFVKNLNILMGKIIEKKVMPIYSFWRLFYDYSFDDDINDPIILCAYLFSYNIGSNPLKKIKVLPLNNESSQKLFIEFLNSGSYENINTMDEQFLSLIASSAISVIQKEKIQIHGIKGVALPFLASCFHFMSFHDGEHFLKFKYKKIFLDACISAEGSQSNFIIESINKIFRYFCCILSNSNDYFYELYADIIEIFMKQFINKSFTGDKFLFIKTIFHLTLFESLFVKIHNLYDTYGTNFFETLIKNFHEIKNLNESEKIKINPKVFKLDEIKSVSIKSIENSSSQEVVNTICLIKKYFIKSFAIQIKNVKNLVIAIKFLIEKNMWNELMIVDSFIQEKNILENHKELIFDNFLFNQNKVEHLIDDILSDQNLEIHDYLLELLFKILMKDPIVKMNYFLILFEKVSGCFILEPEKFNKSFILEPENLLKSYYNEYKMYGNAFIDALHNGYYYHSELKLFVRKINIEYNLKHQSKITKYVISKLFDEVNKNPKNYQAFICLKSIASSFPFLFLNDPEKIFQTVLPAFEYFKYVFIDTNDLGDDQIDNVKASLSAMYFLLETLQIVQILESFVPWIFERITTLTHPQIFSFIYVIDCFIEAKRIKYIMRLLFLKNNIFDKYYQLLQNDISNELFAYKTAIFRHISTIFNQINKINGICSLIDLEELLKSDKPLTLFFNNSMSIYPIKIQPVSVLSINKNIKTFNENISKSRPFWIDYFYDFNNEIGLTEIESFLVIFYKLDKKNQPPKIIQPLEFPSELNQKQFRFLSQQQKWISLFVIRGFDFPLFPEHLERLKEIINNLNSLQNEKDEGTNFNFLFTDFSISTCNKYYLFQKIFDEIMFSESLNHKIPSDSISQIIKNDICLCSIIEISKSIINEHKDNIEILNRFLQAIISIDVCNNTTFKFNFSKIFGQQLVEIALDSRDLIDPIFLKNLLKILKFSNIIPNKVNHLISLMIILDDDQMISAALDLYNSIEIKNDEQIKNLIEISFNKQISKDEISPKFILLFLKSSPSLFDSKKSIIPDLLNKLIESCNVCKNNDAIHLICYLLNFLAPERKDDQLIFTNDEIKSSSSNQSLCTNNNNPQIVLKRAPKNLFQTDLFFWNLYRKSRSLINDTLIKDEIKIDEISFLLNYPELLSFEKRLAYFRRKMKNKIFHWDELNINVRRSTILVDSFRQLYNRPKEEWLKEISVNFENEKGIDLGGLTTEWFTLVVKEIFNPNFALFTLTENKSYQPNQFSDVNAEHIDYFKFAGKFIARAIIQGQCVNAHFTKSFCRQILNRKLTLKDLEDFDENLYKSLQKILKDDVEPLMLNFTINVDDFGEIKSIPLKENGEEIDVTNENKYEYVKFYAFYRLRKSILNQVDAFCEGFNSLISPDELKIFLPNEFDLVLCGIPVIDVNDLMKNTDFIFPYIIDHPVIVLFFKTISKWSPENLAKLLMFITGSSQVPVNGFVDYVDRGKPIKIAPGGDKNRLCVAHTCFNRLDLPEYENEDELNKKLMQSIQECEFGIQ